MARFTLRRSSTQSALRGGDTLRGVDLIAQSLSGVVSFAGALDVFLFQRVAVDGAASFGGVLAMTEAVPLSGAVSFAGNAAYTISVAVDGAIAVSGALALKALVAIEGVLTTAGNVAVIAKVGLAGAVSLTGATAVKVSHSLAGAVSFTGALSLIPYTLTILANAIQSRYKPRALFTLTIGAVTKRYSTKDVEVP